MTGDARLAAPRAPAPESAESDTDTRAEAPRRLPGTLWRPLRWQWPRGRPRICSKSPGEQAKKKKKTPCLNGPYPLAEGLSEYLCKGQ